MKHFITFQKMKGLYLLDGPEKLETSTQLAMQINHELMKIGYIISKELFASLETQSTEELQEIYTDLVAGITLIVGGSGYEPIYRNFPQSVVEMSYGEFFINAIIHYWSMGTWRPEDSEYINREFKIEPVNYKRIKLLDESDYDSIFTGIMYSGTSISKFDKECIDWGISNGEVSVHLNKIKFRETQAYIGKRMLDVKSITELPTNNATTVLRIWTAYSGGDEGLKENTKFKNPSSRQCKVLRETLDKCYNLEDSLKGYREEWLRLLYYLNPLVKKYKTRYPTLYSYTALLRNTPEKMETFNGKIERMIREENFVIFELLRSLPGIFTRRLDHLVRVFGKKAIDEYLDIRQISFMNLATAYNHFSTRDQEQAGRTVILANQSKSEVSSFEALAPLSTELVTYIKDNVMLRLRGFRLNMFNKRRVYIDRSLYFTPLSMNNRASSISLDVKSIGTSELYSGDKTLRMYVHWEGKTDIDLTCMILTTDGVIHKIGWDGGHHFQNSVIYSGDNTGHSTKNAEYIDINTHNISKEVEWLIIDANIYSGPNNFKGYNGKCHMGWMEITNPEANTHWQPELLQNATMVNSEARNAYLMAYHIPSKNIVYLDMALNNQTNITGAEDAVKMKVFLEKIVTKDDGLELQWDKLNQGHLIHLRAYSSLVESVKDADVIFDETTSPDEISRLITF